MQITAENQFTPPFRVQGHRGWDVVVDGTFNATITIEVSKSSSGPFVGIGTTDTPGLMTAVPATMWYVRAGVRPGDYTSGNIEVEVY